MTNYFEKVAKKLKRHQDGSDITMEYYLLNMNIILWLIFVTKGNEYEWISWTDEIYMPIELKSNHFLPQNATDCNPDFLRCSCFVLISVTFDWLYFVIVIVIVDDDDDDDDDTKTKITLK